MYTWFKSLPTPIGRNTRFSTATYLNEFTVVSSGFILGWYWKEYHRIWGKQYYLRDASITDCGIVTSTSVVNKMSLGAYSVCLAQRSKPRARLNLNTGTNHQVLALYGWSPSTHGNYNSLNSMILHVGLVVNVLIWPCLGIVRNQTPDFPREMLLRHIR